ncbi:hypothetical protein CDL15_Pgr012115 [Punica granatum]|uniref:S-protein homolog n=1 Tax=Punica granatum TaxID=22663 RepID=A0A218XKU9_PUNGR|nr:hypothetical protein CDL15_Pgr012115 [Punica granatum]
MINPVFCFRKYHVHIISNFSEDLRPLLVHCRSKDDDLGAQFLLPQPEYLIRFKIDLFRRTRFTCEVEQGQTKTEFTAFTCSRDEDRCRHRDCYWSVGPDGFYFSKDMQNWDKEYPSPPHSPPP